MNKNFGAIFIAMILVACQQAAPPAAEDAAAAAGAPQATHPGEAEYMKYCAECHDKAVYK